MNSRFRFWWVLLPGLALAFLVAAPVGARWWVAAQLTPERLVRKVEARWNCRAEMGETALRWSWSGAELKLRDVSLGERDRWVTDGAPPGDREPMREAVLRSEELRLSVASWPLLWGRIHVRELAAKGVQADITVPKEGENSLKSLLRRPGWEEKRKERRRRPGDRKRGGDDGGTEENLRVEDLPFAAWLDRAAIEDASIYVHLEKYGTRLVGSDVYVDATNIRVDPKALGRENHAELKMRGTATLDSAAIGGLVYGQLKLRGEGEAVPFDAKTGELEPELRCRFDVVDGSFIDVMPMLDKVEQRIGDLADFGIELDNLALKGNLRAESVLHLSYRDDLYTLLDDSELRFEQYDLALRSGSSYDGDANSHDFRCGLRLTPESTASALARLDRFVERKLKVVKPETVRQLIEQSMIDEDRLTVAFRSQGDFGDPHVKLTSDLPDLEELLKEAARELTKDPGSLIDGIRKLFE
ncbi:MAG TPA: hypothetical protein VMN36_07630 [Verrucomicrobiales bacterium]|nr:hypothetical protein [Verrucomicrobiales bacterium]